MENKRNKIDMGSGLEIITLVDCVEKHPVSEYFPKVTKRELESMEKNYCSYVNGGILDPFLFCCYLIRTKGKNILVDTGVGDSNLHGRKKEGLLSQLDKLKLSPEDIDIVVFTHLHPDHIGWNTIEEKGKITKTFKRAAYIAHTKEYAYISNQASEGNFNTELFRRNIYTLKEKYELHLIEDDEYNLTKEIKTKRFPGHTPGSICIEIDNGKEIAAIVGDVFSNPMEIENPELEYVFDWDKGQAIRARKNFLEIYKKKMP
ncbi:MAG: MBL fold metallo-hydrolase [Anaerovoracaceae bacterium]|jgi:glyoxylase-like metal-dependent hydrolase (beta-lactamase superfamily II)